MFSIIKHQPRFNRGMKNFHDEMNRIFCYFDDFDYNERRWMPSVDIVEEDEKYMLSAELSGIDKKDVKIGFQNNILTIEGEKNQNNELKENDYCRTERFYGKFSRSFTLSSDIDSGKIDANYSNGVLTVTLPKSEKVKPKQIEIK